MKRFRPRVKEEADKEGKSLAPVAADWLLNCQEVNLSQVLHVVLTGSSC